jgi:hypothetical protein
MMPDEMCGGIADSNGDGYAEPSEASCIANKGSPLICLENGQVQGSFFRFQ